MPTITAESHSLARTLATIARVVERKNTTPVLGNILVVARPGGITLRGTDLDIDISAGLAAECDEAGAITLPGHTLADIAAKCGEGSQIRIEWVAGEPRATIRSGRSRFVLPVIDATEFPDITAGDMGWTQEMPAADLRAMMQRPAFAISTEETRYYLNGIYLHQAEGRLVAVATDGHRLARLIGPETADFLAGGIIVPRKAVGEIARITKDFKGSIALEASPAKVRVTAGEITLTTKLIDGTYPDYQRVIPARNEKIARLDSKTLAAAIDRVSALGAAGRPVKCTFDAGTLTVSVTNPDTGEARDELAAGYDSPTLETGFNGSYLAAIIAALPPGEIIAALNDPGSPALFSTETDGAFCAVLMPMRV